MKGSKKALEEEHGPTLLLLKKNQFTQKIKEEDDDDRYVPRESWNEESKNVSVFNQGSLLPTVRDLKQSLSQRDEKYPLSLHKHHEQGKLSVFE